MEKSLHSSLHLSTRQLTAVGMLSAISIILGFTPLGYIPIPPVSATIMHVPVIIGALIEGPEVGFLIGLIFGISSIVQSIMKPTVLSFLCLNPLVSVLPRVLIGITTYYSFKLIKVKNTALRTSISAFIGSATNTVGFLFMVFLIYLGPYAKSLGISEKAAKIGIATIGFTNGIPEAIVSILITVPVVIAVRKIRKIKD